MFLSQIDNGFIPASDINVEADNAFTYTSAATNIWPEIYSMATELTLREPLLVVRMKQLVLERSSLPDMVAAILAYKLASEDMPQIALHHLMLDIFETDQIIMTQIMTDLLAVKNRDPACLNHLHTLLNMKGFHALQTYRITHWLWQKNRKELAFSLANMASLIFCVDIHPAASIGSGVMLDHGTGIVIGETTVIDNNVSILQDVTLGGTGKEQGDRHPKIHNGVMIGAGAKILGNIKIGAMSKIAAGSVVLEEVPSHCTVAGVPARIVRRHVRDGLPAFEMNQSISQDK